eukprot:c6339_g1_i1.p1 GENE.c6339_g1_i1~~c6339_g1_i1.p1  ORF type:complete len:1818 (+),score=264.71 c6339_g1_i1:42-5495(+)
MDDQRRRGTLGLNEISRRVSRSPGNVKYKPPDPVRPRPGASVANQNNGKALVLVNLQNDFFSDWSEASRPLFGATKELVEKCNQIRQEIDWDLVVLCGDCFPSNHISFKSNNPGVGQVHQQNREWAHLHTLLPDHCVLGSKGQQFHPDLTQLHTDVIILNGRDPTKIPWGTSDDHLDPEKTLLVSYLHGAQISEVYLAGLMLDGKVVEIGIQLADIAHHQWQHPLSITVIENACISSTPRERQAGIASCAKHNILTLSIEDCRSKLAANRRNSMSRFGNPQSDKLCEDILSLALLKDEISDSQIESLRQAIVTDMSSQQQEQKSKDTLVSRPETCVEILDRATGHAVIHYLCIIGSLNAIRLLKMIFDNDLGSIVLPSKHLLETPLLLACRFGKIEVLDMLLNNNAKVEFLKGHLEENDIYGTTAMLHVISTANILALDYLMNAKTDSGLLLRVMDKNKRNALMHATEAYNHGGRRGKEVYQKLQKFFPDKHFQTKVVDTAHWCFWHYAAKHGLENEIIQRLKVSNGAMPSTNRPENTGHPANWMLYYVDITQIHATSESRYVSIKEAIEAQTLNKLTMLHLAVTCDGSQSRLRILEFLIARFREFRMHNYATASGMNALDIALENLDPTISFVLVREGCTPSFYASDSFIASTKVLLYKALFLGEATIVRILLSQHAHNVSLDRHLLNLAINQKYTHICSNHFATFRSDTLQQPWYRVDSDTDQLVCITCALTCHKRNNNVAFQTLGVGHGRCQCSTLQQESIDGFSGCVSQSKVEANNTHTNVVRVPPIHIQKRHVRSPTTNSVSHKGESHFFGETVPQAERFGALSSNAPVPIASTDLHYDYIIKVLLYSAASYGQAEYVRELARMVSDIEFNDLDESEETPVHAAIRHNHPEVCAILVQFSAITNSKLDTVNAAGASYLTLASAFGYADICRIVATDENVFKMDCLGLTPIHHAVRNNHPVIVRHLARRIQRTKLQRGSRSTNTLDDMYLHDTHKAITSSQSRPLSTASVPDFTMTGVTMAALVGPNDINSGRVTIDSSEVPESYMNPENKGTLEAHASPLHLAVIYGNFECVDELLAAGASPSTKDSTGFAPYKTALWQDYQAKQNIPPLEQRGRAQSTAAQQVPPLSPTSILPTIAPSSDSKLNPDVTSAILRRMILDRTIRRKRRRFAFKRFYQEMVIPCILALVFLMLTLPKSSATYLTRRWLNSVLEVDTLQSYTRFDDVWGWVNTHLVNETSLFPSAYESTQITHGLLLLGPIEIRQQKSRIEMKELDVVNDAVLYPKLPRRYSSLNEDKNFFSNINFASMTSSNGTVNSYAGICDGGIWDKDANNPWEYHHPKGELDETDFFGSYKTGGFVALLSSDTNNGTVFNQKRLDCLQATEWIDEFTRALIVDISLFNMNTGVFTAIHILVTFGMTGEMRVTFKETSSTLGYGIHDDLQVEQLNRFDYPSYAMEVVAAFQLCGILISVIFKSVQRFKASTKSNRWWAAFRATFNLNHSFDLVLISLLIVLLGFDFKAKSEIKNTFTTSFRVDQTSFVDLTGMLGWVSLETGVLSFVTLLVWLRFLAYCLLLPVAGPLIIAVLYSIQAKSVLTFLFLLLYVLIGFMLAFRMVLAQIYHCREYFQSFVLLVQMMIQDWNDDAYSQVDSSDIGPFLFIAFMLAVSLIYMNLFISVLSEVYPQEKRRAEKQYHDMISRASQVEYIKRSNPLLRQRTNNRILKFIHSIAFRPVLEPLSQLATVAFPRLFHRSNEIQSEAFGWTLHRDKLRLFVVQQSKGSQEAHDDDDGDSGDEKIDPAKENALSRLNNPSVRQVT